MDDNFVTVLPDGSAFAIASCPLPKDHWLYANGSDEWDTQRDTSKDTPLPIMDRTHKDKIIAAAKWAIRGATMNGKEDDFDPDAMVLNFVYALCGPVNTVSKSTTDSQDREIDRDLASFLTKGE